VTGPNTAIELRDVSGEIRLLENTVTNNGGRAVNILGEATVTVQNNRITAGAPANPQLITIQKCIDIQFDGNCVTHSPPLGDSIVPAVSLIASAGINDTGNVVQTSGAMAVSVESRESVTTGNRVKAAPGGGPALSIAASAPSLATGNLTSSLLTSPSVVRSNNVPAP
jgi:hypothetical protein